MADIDEGLSDGRKEIATLPDSKGLLPLRNVVLLADARTRLFSITKEVYITGVSSHVLLGHYPERPNQVDRHKRPYIVRRD